MREADHVGSRLRARQVNARSPGRCTRPPHGVGSTPPRSERVGVERVERVPDPTNEKDNTGMTTITARRVLPADTTVAERLAAALEDAGMTPLELAPKIADRDTDETSVYRLVNKWLSGKH